MRKENKMKLRIARQNKSKRYAVETGLDCLPLVNRVVKSRKLKGN